MKFRVYYYMGSIETHQDFTSILGFCEFVERYCDTIGDYLEVTSVVTL